MELEPIQILAIELFLSGYTVNEVAIETKNSLDTIYRWRADKDFQEELRRKEKERLEAIINKWLSLYLEALNNIGEEIEKGNIEVSQNFIRGDLNWQKIAKSNN